MVVVYGKAKIVSLCQKTVKSFDLSRQAQDVVFWPPTEDHLNWLLELCCRIGSRLARMAKRMDISCCDMAKFSSPEDRGIYEP